MFRDAWQIATGERSIKKREREREDGSGEKETKKRTWGNRATLFADSLAGVSFGTIDQGWMQDRVANIGEWKRMRKRESEDRCGDDSSQGIGFGWWKQRRQVAHRGKKNRS